MKILISASLTIVFGLFVFYVGWLEGASYFKLRTEVRTGFPYYTGVFYGKCTKVRDIQTNLIGEACATEPTP